MLAKNFDEVKGVEAKQQHQLVLTFPVITGSLWDIETCPQFVCKNIFVSTLNKSITKTN